MRRGKIPIWYAVNLFDAVTPGKIPFPGLPNEVASRILVSLPYSQRCRLRLTPRHWRNFLTYESVAPLRRILRFAPHQIFCIFPSDPFIVRPFLFDSSTAAWSSVPPLPCSPSFYGLCNFAAVCLGDHLYIVGGCHFDARRRPHGYLLPSAAVYRIYLADFSTPWTRLADMILPRGSFACAPIARAGKVSIIVAGGGIEHPVFESIGDRMSSVEIYDVDSGEWAASSGMPRYRSGSVVFFRMMEDGDEEGEFWVMGGCRDYNESPGMADMRYCSNALVLGLRSGTWRQVRDMWEQCER